MAHASVAVRHSEHETWLDVIGVGRVPIGETDDDFVGPREVVEKINLSSLRRTLIGYAGTESPMPATVMVDDPRTGERRVIRLPTSTSPERCAVLPVDVAADKFAERHTYEFVPEPVCLALISGGVLTVRVTHFIEGEDQPDRARLDALLGPLLKREGASIAHVDVDAEGVVDFAAAPVRNDDFWTVHVYIAVPTHGRDAASALRVGRDALALLEAAERGTLTRATTEALILGGHAELLLGHREGAWLDCKEQPYRADEASLYELAKDVSAFANTQNGGLIVIGLGTRKVSGGDTIARIRPVPLDEKRVERYRRALQYRVHPRVSGLLIDEVHQGRGRIVLISVPPQPKALQPFLVRGAVRDGKVLGSSIALYIRENDGAITAGVEEVHALIVAGRAALGYAGAVPEQP